MSDDLTDWLYQQFENQRFRGESLKTLAFALPPETGAYLTETGELLLADVQAKRRILDLYEHRVESMRRYPNQGNANAMAALQEAVRLLALPYADRPGYRDEWKP